METHITINIDPVQKILLKRGLNKDGRCQQFFTSEVARLSDAYVPMDTGMLKNTRVIRKDSITYVQPYARKQYYENKGRGLRGKEWDKRMWAARGNEIVQSVAKMAGGKAK